MSQPSRDEIYAQTIAAARDGEKLAIRKLRKAFSGAIVDFANTRGIDTPHTFANKVLDKSLGNSSNFEKSFNELAYQISKCACHQLLEFDSTPALKMSFEQEVVMMMRVFLGMSQEEAATALNFSDEQVQAIEDETRMDLARFLGGKQHLEEEISSKYFEPEKSKPESFDLFDTKDADVADITRGSQLDPATVPEPVEFKHPVQRTHSVPISDVPKPMVAKPSSNTDEALRNVNNRDFVHQTNQSPLGSILESDNFYAPSFTTTEEISDEESRSLFLIPLAVVALLTFGILAYTVFADSQTNETAAEAQTDETTSEDNSPQAPQIGSSNTTIPATDAELDDPNGDTSETPITTSSVAATTSIKTTTTPTTRPDGLAHYTGTVKQSSGIAASFVKINLISPTNNYTLNTGQDGSFVFDAVEPGCYDQTIVASNSTTEICFTQAQLLTDQTIVVTELTPAPDSCIVRRTGGPDFVGVIVSDQPFASRYIFLNSQQQWIGDTGLYGNNYSSGPGANQRLWKASENDFNADVARSVKTINQYGESQSIQCEIV